MSDHVFCRVEVVLALPTVCHRRTVALERGADVGQAVDRSGLVELFRRELGDAPDAYGIFGRKVGRDHVPHDGDRIDLLRPLTIDPKNARRERIQRGAGRSR